MSADSIFLSAEKNNGKKRVTVDMLKEIIDQHAISQEDSGVFSINTYLVSATDDRSWLKIAGKIYKAWTGGIDPIANFDTWKESIGYAKALEMLADKITRVTMDGDNKYKNFVLTTSWNTALLKDHHCYKKTCIGMSDYSTLLVYGPCDDDKAGVIHFGEDGTYTAYLVGEHCLIPDHYHLVYECRHWIKIYDDDGLTYEDSGNYVFKIFRAENFGCIIQRIPLVKQQ